MVRALGPRAGPGPTPDARGRYPGGVTTRTPLARGAWRALALLLPMAGALLLAGPASAVPEGWSKPDPVSGLAALTVFVFGPLALVAVVAALAMFPQWASAAKESPAVTATEDDTAHLDELFAGDEPEALEAAEEPADS